MLTLTRWEPTVLLRVLLNTNLSQSLFVARLIIALIWNNTLGSTVIHLALAPPILLILNSEHTRSDCKCCAADRADSASAACCGSFLFLKSVFVKGIKSYPIATYYSTVRKSHRTRKGYLHHSYAHKQGVPRDCLVMCRNGYT